jgi:ADP-ribose pyrophosphatase YjhB (NUDIX family)
MPAVRLSIKAIIVRDQHLLVLKNLDAQGEWYMLPGGGQEFGETIPDTLRRECLEEIGAEVAVGRLRFVRDYIARYHEFAATDGNVHQVELMFECELRSEPAPGSKPDSMQTGIAWIDLHELPRFRFYPAILREMLAAGAGTGEPHYLGNVN